MSNFRKIEGLQWVKPGKPKAGQRARPGSAKLAGLEWEREVEEVIFQETRPGSTFIKGLWLHFRDSNGLGYCQPDFIFTRNHSVIVVECKLSWHSYSLRQVQGLYLPLVGHLYQKKPLGLIAVQGKDKPSLRDSIEKLLTQPAFSTLRW